MWETISGIVIKYWVEFLLAGGVSVGGYYLRRLITLSHKERVEKQDEHFKRLLQEIQTEHRKSTDELLDKYTEVQNELQDKYMEVTSDVERRMALGRAESKQDDKEIEDKLDVIADQYDVLRSGILAMHGKEFKDCCRRLLKEDHTITLEEWEEIDADHNVYNGLGGNHNGDHLFELVKKKAEKDLTD